jgi:proteic killer suppression protein
VIRSFKNEGTEDLFNGVDSKAARKVCAQAAMKAAQKRLVALEAAKTLGDLKSPGYALEKLERDRKGQHAIRINDQYRICFVWGDQGAEQVEVTDYH